MEIERDETAFPETENSFEFNRVRYIAILSSRLCKGCAFELISDCPAMHDHPCEEEIRQDHQNVIF